MGIVKHLVEASRALITLFRPVPLSKRSVSDTLKSKLSYHLPPHIEGPLPSLCCASV